jgi:CSLREA domain-containing protein
MRRTLAALLVPLSLLLVSVGAVPARGASELTVDTYEDTFDGSCADVDCSVRDAISAVDTGGTVRLPPGFYSCRSRGAAASGRATSTSAVR